MDGHQPVEKRAWHRAARGANLTAEGGGLFGSTDFSGTVDGLAVRARTITRREGGGGEGGSSKVTYTVVEAALGEPASEGLVIARGDGDGVAGVTAQGGGLEYETVDGFGVIGDSTELARAALTGRSKTTLREPARLDSVFVWNASDVLLAAVPDSDGAIVGRITDSIEKRMAAKLPGDAGTVRTQTKGLILDSEELQRQATAVATVAGEFEAARGS